MSSFSKSWLFNLQSKEKGLGTWGAEGMDSLDIGLTEAKNIAAPPNPGAIMGQTNKKKKKKKGLGLTLESWL
jgi:hypothetical protein